MKNRLRSSWDVNVFTLCTLRPPSIGWVVFSGVIFVSGVILWIGELFDHYWVAVIVGLLGLGKDVVPLIMRWCASPPASLKADDRLPQLLKELHLPHDYRDDGYRIDKVPCRPDEYVVRSSSVDSFLRSHDIALKEDRLLLKRINERLQSASKMEDALRCQYRQSWRTDPPKRFVNEAKTCLGEDLSPSQQTLLIYKGSYFHSFLTNELVTRILVPRVQRPEISYRGSDYFPAEEFSDGTRVLKRIPESLMANHIGVSTVVLTSDHKLALWCQSDRAQQSQDLLAPTGSGSCDWSDWTSLSRGSLKKLISRAMERELREESLARESKLAETAFRTEVLGFFRWARRGGKPEFVGITIIETPLIALRPNMDEVDAPYQWPLAHPAFTLAQLRNSVAMLLQSDRLSVPLWANLTCLRDALESDPDKWAAFLKIGR